MSVLRLFLLSAGLGTNLAESAFMTPRESMNKLPAESNLKSDKPVGDSQGAPMQEEIPQKHVESIHSLVEPENDSENKKDRISSNENSCNGVDPSNGKANCRHGARKKQKSTSSNHYNAKDTAVSANKSDLLDAEQTSDEGNAGMTSFLKSLKKKTLTKFDRTTLAEGGATIAAVSTAFFWWNYGKGASSAEATVEDAVEDGALTLKATDEDDASILDTSRVETLAAAKADADIKMREFFRNYYRYKKRDDPGFEPVLDLVLTSNAWMQAEQWLDKRSPVLQDSSNSRQWQRLYSENESTWWLQKLLMSQKISKKFPFGRRVSVTHKRARLFGRLAKLRTPTDVQKTQEEMKNAEADIRLDKPVLEKPVTLEEVDQYLKDREKQQKPAANDKRPNSEGVSNVERATKKWVEATKLLYERYHDEFERDYDTDSTRNLSISSGTL